MGEASNMHPAVAAARALAGEISVLRGRVDAAFRELKDASGQSFQLHGALPGQEFTYEDLDSQLLALLGHMDGLRDIERSALIPAAPAARAAEHATALRDQLTEIARLLDDARNQGVQSIEPGLWALTKADGQRVKFGSLLPNILSKLGEVADHLAPVTMFARTAVDFSSVIAAAQRQTAALHTLVDQATNAASHAGTEQGRAAQFARETENDRKEVERLLSLIERDKKTVDEQAAAVVAGNERVKSEVERATVLEGTVTNYQANFDTFKASLEDREASFKARDAEQTTLSETLKANEKEMARILAAADGMLKGATVAGLASAYGNTRSKLSRELWWARLAFNLGIVLLIASVMPLAVFVVPHLAERLGLTPPPAPTDPTLYGLQIAARLVLLVPAAWYLRFAANRHSALFRLREEYGHSYALASSVEGFKRQAEGYKEEIAAGTFEQLTVNPARALDGHGKSDGDPPNPIMKALLDKLQGKEPKKEGV